MSGLSIRWYKPPPRFRVRFRGPDGGAKVENSTPAPSPVITYIGQPGEGANPLVFDQTVASDEWIINHNLGFYPVVAILSPGGVEVEAQTVHITTNQARVLFNQPYAGRAVVR